MTARPSASPSVGWSARALASIDGLAVVAVSASSTDDVWLAGAHGVLVHTPDHGKTFERCDLGVDDPIQSISAASPDDVWLLGAERVLHVENRATVGVLSAALPSHCGQPFAGILATPNASVWVASGIVRRSKDGGLSWARQPTGAMGSPGEGDECIDEIHGDAHELWTDAGFGVRHSVDGGSTWSAVGWSPSTETALHVAVAPDGEVWVAAQESGEIGRSTDHGATWTGESLGAWSPARRLWGIAAVGQGWVWAYAADGLWVRRGKAPWAREATTTGIAGIVGTSKDDVWAVASGGVVLHRP